MQKKREEYDLLGQREMDADALYGIHSLRAKENFPARELFHPEWYKSVGIVKVAVYQTIERFRGALISKYQRETFPFYLPSQQVLEALQAAALYVAEGNGYSHMIVPALTGGGGTSQHMNVNEIITNRALLSLGSERGNYKMIDPFEDANIFQSTNDVMPTALHVAVMRRLKHLEKAINQLRAEVEKKESRYRDVLRLGYTQMQEAVPLSWGKFFSAYSDAFSRDWWRVSKAFERIKVVNLGGSAVGTSLGVPRFYLMEVVSTLQKLTGLPVARGENLVDATANHDALVEVHAILKAMAVNLEKMASDLRLLSSGVVGAKGLTIPAVQAGSTIMAGKVNPVIPEFVISAAHKVYANDQLLSHLVGQGSLELNAYLPLIGHTLLDSLDLLVEVSAVAAEKLVSSLEVDIVESEKEVFFSPSVTVALNPIIGYHKSTLLARKMIEERLDVFEANEKLRVVHPDKLNVLMKPNYLLQAGFTMNDVMKHDE